MTSTFAASKDGKGTEAKFSHPFAVTIDRRNSLVVSESPKYEKWHYLQIFRKRSEKSRKVERGTKWEKDLSFFFWFPSFFFGEFWLMLFGANQVQRKSNENYAHFSEKNFPCSVSFWQSSWKLDLLRFRNGTERDNRANKKSWDQMIKKERDRLSKMTRTQKVERTRGDDSHKKTNNFKRQRAARSRKRRTRAKAWMERQTDLRGNKIERRWQHAQHCNRKEERCFPDVLSRTYCLTHEQMLFTRAKHDVLLAINRSS